ncbi:MAG: oxidoreductase [Solirubrobacteraceae bacterium]
MTDHRRVELGDQTGKTVLVTGSTGGLGWRTASALAGAGARVVITGRRQTALAEAKDSIRVSHPHADLDSSVVDLANLSSIHEFVEQAKERWPAIDVLINNAGVMAIPERRLTVDGFETHFGTNHLGHFALSGLLLPLLLAAPAPRVVTVSAVISRRGRLDFENLDYHTGYRPMRAYASSKLANVMFAVELAQRSTGTGLISVAVHPGTAMTGIQRHGGRLTKALAGALLEPLLGQSPADAARPSLLAATAADVVSGWFYGPRQRFESRGFPGPLKLPSLALDPAVRGRLWETSAVLTGVSYALPDAITPSAR